MSFSWVSFKGPSLREFSCIHRISSSRREKLDLNQEESGGCQESNRRDDYEDYAQILQIERHVNSSIKIKGTCLQLDPLLAYLKG